jgi:hypothetical protein
MEAFPCSKNIQTLQSARFEYSEQLSPLGQLPILNINQVKNPGTDSIFESSMNSKGVQTFWEKSDKFSNILP